MQHLDGLLVNELLFSIGSYSSGFAWGCLKAAEPEAWLSCLSVGLSRWMELLAGCYLQAGFWSSQESVVQVKLLVGFSPL